MKKEHTMVIILLILLVVSNGAWVISSQLQSLPKEKSLINVGAYYYVWYGNNSGGLGSAHWNSSDNIVVDTPLDGFYSSANPDEIHKQLQEMVNIGINFVAISWWGINDSTDSNSQLAFNIIQNYSLPIRACIIVEPFNESSENYTANYNLTTIYNYIYNTFVLSYSSIYKKLYDLPLILFYNSNSMTSSRTVPFDNRFNTRISGHQYYTNWVYWSFNNTSAQPWTQENQPLCIDEEIDVCPRYDDYYQRPNYFRFDISYSQGSYDAQWSNAIHLARAGTVKIVMISTWNEYHERTQIEPCKDLTSAYISDYIYQKTKAYITELKSA